MTYLNDEQIAQLLRPINPRRVSQRDGMSHLEAYDVRAHLIRILGPARFSADLLDLAQLFEAEGEKSKEGKTWRVWSVGYRATVRLTVCAPDGTVLATYTEAATGDATNFPDAKRADAHDFAIKTAESQALKRCAVNLGDQFGLSLYAKGSTSAVVGRTLISTTAKADEAVDAHVTEVVPESEQVEAAPDNHSQSEPPQRLETNSDAKTDRVSELRDALLAAKTRSAVSAIAITVSKEGLRNAMTDDGQGNVCSVGALLDDRLKKVARAS